MSENVYKTAESPQTPVSMLARLIKIGDYNVRRAVARNPSATTKILAKLAKDEDTDVRCEVAMCCKAPEILIELIKDEHVTVRYYALKNPNLPDTVKFWVENGFAELSLEEFMEKMGI